MWWTNFHSFLSSFFSVLLDWNFYRLKREIESFCCLCIIIFTNYYITLQWREWHEKGTNAWHDDEMRNWRESRRILDFQHFSSFNSHQQAEISSLHFRYWYARSVCCEFSSSWLSLVRSHNRNKIFSIYINCVAKKMETTERRAKREQSCCCHFFSHVVLVLLLRGIIISFTSYNSSIFSPHSISVELSAAIHKY